jgi:hypothetical protein
MSTQIAAGLPDAQVAFPDCEVAQGHASGRAQLVRKALPRMEREPVAAGDLEVIIASGANPYPELEGMLEQLVGTCPGIDQGHPIHLVGLDKIRPALVLTRAVAAAHLSAITVAAITTPLAPWPQRSRSAPGTTSTVTPWWTASESRRSRGLTCWPPSDCCCPITRKIRPARSQAFDLD